MPLPHETHPSHEWDSTLVISGAILFLWHSIFEALFVDILDHLKRVSPSFFIYSTQTSNVSFSPSLSPFHSQGSEQKAGAVELVSLSRLLFSYLYQLQAAGRDSGLGTEGVVEREICPEQDVLSIPV